MNNLKSLYRKCIKKWERLLNTAETYFNLDDFLERKEFISNYITIPCAFCINPKVSPEVNKCLINPSICSCIRTDSQDSLYRKGINFKTHKKIVRWIKYMIMALTIEWKQ